MACRRTPGPRHPAHAALTCTAIPAGRQEQLTACGLHPGRKAAVGVGSVDVVPAMPAPARERISPAARRWSARRRSEEGTVSPSVLPGRLEDYMVRIENDHEGRSGCPAPAAGATEHPGCLLRPVQSSPDRYTDATTARRTPRLRYTPSSLPSCEKETSPACSSCLQRSSRHGSRVEQSGSLSGRRRAPRMAG